MLRFALLLLLTLLPAPALAATRSYAVGSFERVRVDGPFEVRIATGKSPGASAEGGQALIDRLDIAVNGTTLVVRLGAEGWGGFGGHADAGSAPVITLTTPRLIAASVSSGARLTVAGRMAAQRVDLSVTGSGVLAVAAADTDQLTATLVGSGAIKLGGRAARARLVNNGQGAIDATALAVNDLIATQDGAGAIDAAARYTAQVTSNGLGKVSVLGNAKCTVKAIAGGPVACGPRL